MLANIIHVSLETAVKELNSATKAITTVRKIYKNGSCQKITSVGGILKSNSQI